MKPDDTSCDDTSKPDLNFKDVNMLHSTILLLFV